MKQAHTSKYHPGRATEEIIYGYQKISGGASSDLANATTHLRKLISENGLFASEGTVTSYVKDNLFNNLFSDNTKNHIDQKISKILNEAYAIAIQCMGVRTAGI